MVPGDNFKDFGRGPLANVTIQISKLQAYRFKRKTVRVGGLRKEDFIKCSFIFLFLKTPCWGII